MLDLCKKIPEQCSDVINGNDGTGFEEEGETIDFWPSLGRCIRGAVFYRPILNYPDYQKTGLPKQMDYRKIEIFFITREIFYF